MSLAAQTHVACNMRLAGRVFETPVVNSGTRYIKFHMGKKGSLKKHVKYVLSKISIHDQHWSQSYKLGFAWLKAKA